MGDSEGARDILDEVLAEGNDSQQAEARELLERLARSGNEATLMNDVVPPAAAESAAAGVSRIALGIEYKGSAHRGWQRREAGVPSVQEALERPLSKVAAEPVGVICAGRTDAAVHASGQVVHFDTAVERPLKAWVMGTNANLPADISVTWARVMPAHFHARFSAMARRYRYAIYNDPIRPAHLAEEVTWNHRPLDIGRMREAAQVLVGTHDFTSFRAVQCQAKSPVKTMHHVRLLEHGRLIVLDIRGNAFLHHMVRNIAGVLMTIGAGERPIEWAKEVLEARDRRAGGVTAHPYGLYLVRVEYPGEFEVARALPGAAFLPDCPISSADVESGFCYHREFPAGPAVRRFVAHSPRILRRCQPFASRSAVSPESRTPWPLPRRAPMPSAWCSMRRARGRWISIGRGRSFVPCRRS